MSLVTSPLKIKELSAIRARQYFDIIFYWLEGGILQPNQIIEPQFKNFRNSLQARIKEPFTFQR